MKGKIDSWPFDALHLRLQDDFLFSNLRKRQLVKDVPGKSWYVISKFEKTLDVAWNFGLI